MAHEIASVVRCKLCPPATAKAIAGPTLVLGPGQAPRVGAFMQSLAEHIAQAHPQQHEYLQQKALEFMGLQTVMQYTTTDQNIRFSRNWLRWQIHQATLDARIPDDKLEASAAEFAASIMDLVVRDLESHYLLMDVRSNLTRTETLTKITAKVIELTRGMREVLQEPTEPKPPNRIRG